MSHDRAIVRSSMSENRINYYFRLEEAVTCSLCHHLFKDAVFLKCGHTFCKACISASRWRHIFRLPCPRCQKKFWISTRTPNYSIRHLVSDLQTFKTELKEKIPDLIPLIYPNIHDSLQLDEYIVNGCFLGQEIKDFPLSVICVIGEERNGESTLMNYILRALYCLEKGHRFIIEETDEPLRGFDWEADSDPSPQAIWMSNRPYILQKNGEKMAVFVLYMEGSLDMDRDTCIKLSALLTLLSSYMVFNINMRLTPVELDFLEMYLSISQLVGSFHSVKNLQHLDLLVRDWNNPSNCGREAAHFYIDNEAEKLKKSQQYSQVLQTLTSPWVSAFLLPQPGLGTPGIDDRALLTQYISDLVNGIFDHCKTDTQGLKMTCNQLGTMLKDFFSLLQNTNYSFSSPEQVKESLDIYQKRNEIIREFQELKKTWNPFSLMISAKKLKFSLLDEYNNHLQGLDEGRRQRLLEEMDSLLTKDLYYAQHSKCIKYLKLVGSVLSWGMFGLFGCILGGLNVFPLQGMRNHVYYTRGIILVCIIGAGFFFFFFIEYNKENRYSSFTTAFQILLKALEWH